MTFILNEDKALKTLLGGVIVSDAKNAERPVGVWFGQPDLEIRDQSFPYITIELIDVARDPSRSHSGILEGEYIYEDDTVYEYEYPIPVNITYQITSYSRNPRHDRQIIDQVMNQKLRMRYGFLYVPEDNTARRVDLLGFAKRDVVEENKRLFINTFSVTINSEVPVSTLRELFAVSDVNIDTQPLEQTQTTIP